MFEILGQHGFVGVQRLTGKYQETLTGLHKIALRTEGAVTLDRISPVDVLNDGKF